MAKNVNVLSMERWVSGLNHRSRKTAGQKWSRGFKSLPFRLIMKEYNANINLS